MCKSDNIGNITRNAAIKKMRGVAVVAAVMVCLCVGCAGANSTGGSVDSAGSSDTVGRNATNSVNITSSTDSGNVTDSENTDSQNATEPAEEAGSESIEATEPIEPTESTEDSDYFVVCLDPGHGGESQGTHYTYDDVEIEEKTLNYKIALRLKAYLEQYDGVKVVIDRDEDSNPEFPDRIAFAAANNADIIVSLHINSKSKDNINPTGCMAITTSSHYQAETAVNSDVYTASRQLALSILSQLKTTGLTITTDWNANKTDGILQRKGSGTYPDGSQCDWYGLIRNATYEGIPAVIVEHAFLSNEGDYRKYLSSDAKLDKLAKADAAGIMNYSLKSIPSLSSPE